MAEMAIIGIIMIFFIVILSLAFSIFYIVALWKLFTKANVEGWKSIVPVYNMIVLCQIIGISPWWLLIVFGTAVVSAIIPIAYLLYLVAAIYFNVIFSISVARSYGESDGFGIGILFLGGIFIPILAFNKSKYLGAKPVNDIIFGNKNANNNQNTNMNSNTNNNDNTNNTNVTTCPNCNNNVESGTAFCTNCGTKL